MSIDIDMSQTSFLEAVVGWDESQCKQNLEDALPKLISQLDETEALQEETGILKIICQSFLPCLDLQEVEDRLFSKITAKSCETWDRVIDSLKETPKQTQMQGEIIAFLELLIELLDCFLLCVKFVQSSASHIEISALHSLPYGTIHLLKGTYSHCKDSSEIYGEVLASVTEPLSVLFKKAHGLQVAFIGMLEKIDVSMATEQDAQDLCYICQGMFEVCQIVTSLDVKLMCSVWKTISRFSTRHKDNVKDGLDVDTMVIYLCAEITNGYQYLFQLAPPLVHSQELSLSQGDSAAFQKSVKVLGYQMRIMMSLIEAFVDYISDCELHVVKLLILLQKNLPPCLKAPAIATQHSDEIKRQLLNATEPLVSTLIGNRKFIEYLTLSDQDLEEDQWLSYLLLLIKVLHTLPKQKDEVQEKWINPIVYKEEEARSDVLTQIFRAVDKCYTEMCVSVSLPGVSCGGKPVREICLFEFVCTCVCAFVGSFPARYFHLLEERLLENLLSNNIFCSLMAVDIWCFLARFGTAELCFQQTTALIDIWSELCSTSLSSHSIIIILIGRLIKFLAPEHQIQLVKSYPPCDNVSLWCEMPLMSLPSSTARDLFEEVFNTCVKNLHNFITKTDKLYKDLLDLAVCLRNMNRLYRNQDLVGKFMTPPHQQTLLKKISDLWNLTDTNVTGPLIELYLAELLQVSGCMITDLQNPHILIIFQCITSKLDDCDSCLKLAATSLLQKCGKMKFSPSPEQPQIFNKISQAFDKVMCDHNALVHTKAIESFTQFAESTPHETLVPECIGSKPFLQDMVVAYLNKTPHQSDGYSEDEYIQTQKNLPVTVKEDIITSGPLSKQSESPSQPASKRKRLQQDECCDQIDNILTTIETKVEELKQCNFDGKLQLPDGRLQPQSKIRLQTICSRLQKILDENG